MKRYFGILRNQFMSNLSYREDFITSIFGIFSFYIVLYFLWKAIFASGDGVIKGATFEQTYVYLVLASCFFRCLSNGVEWEMYFSMIQGDIIIPMVRPLDYQIIMMFGKAGSSVMDLLFFGLPTYIALIILFPSAITFGVNSLFFLVCIVISFLIMFSIEFLIGTISFYTESVWGISMIKNTVIAFFAGVTIPIQFFPEGLKKVADILPFKSVYQDPLSILINGNVDIMFILRTIGFQVLWMIIFMTISRLVHKTMLHRLVVNGG